MFASSRALGDLGGGLAAALVALPASIAFGALVFGALDPSLAPLGAMSGALGAAVLGLVAPQVGGHGGMVTAPCAPAAALTAGLAGALTAAGHPPERVLPLLALMGVQAGVIQALVGLVGLGRLVKFLPSQVVSGYLSAVGVLIAAGQLPRWLGLPADEGLGGLLQPSLWRGEAIAVGVVTVGLVVGAPRWLPRWPAPVVGLAGGLATYGLLAVRWPALRRLADNPLLVGPVGEVPLGDYVVGRVVGLAGVGLADLALVAGASFTLAALLTVDTLKTAVLLDVTSPTRHDARRELVAQGLANVASALVGGLPGGATLGPTMVNVASGGRTPWSGVAAGAFSLAALFLLPWLGWLPVPALAGLLLVVAARMVDWSSLRLAAHASARVDLAVIVVVVAVAVAEGLIQAALVGTTLAALLFLRDQSQTPVLLGRQDLGRARSRLRRSPSAIALLDAHGAEARVVDLGGSLFFGTTDRLLTELDADLRRCRFVLLDLRRVRSMDYTGAKLIQRMRERLEGHGGQLLFSGMPGPSSPVQRTLAELHLVGEGGIPVFEHRNHALEWMEDQLLAAHGQGPEVHAREPMPAAALSLLHDLPPEARDALVGVLRTLPIAEGELVFRHGDPADTLYVVASGAVDLELPLRQGASHHLATISRDDHFGEMGFLDGGHRTADARARRPSVILALDRSRFDEVVARFPEVGVEVFRRLAVGVSLRLRQADRELEALEDR